MGQVARAPCDLREVTWCADQFQCVVTGGSFWGSGRFRTACAGIREFVGRPFFLSLCQRILKNFDMRYCEIF